MTKNYRYFLYSIFLCFTLAYNLPTFCFSLTQWFSNLFSDKKIEQMTREFPAQEHIEIEINNTNGSTTVTTWKQESISFEAVKKASEKEIDNISVEVEMDDNLLFATTKFATPKTKGQVDFNLIVPEQTTIKLIQNKNGKITIKNVAGDINVQTDNGAIDISNTTKNVQAKTDNGKITIKNANGDIDVKTDNGIIDISDTTKNVRAKTDNGAIKAAIKQFKNDAHYELVTKNGKILLFAPKDINANIVAHVKNGSIISEHEISLAEYTMEINKKTLDQLRKNIQGTIGDGGGKILLKSGNGIIKILQT
ncbi:DUF4097 family beta strand repeat protein [bacterium]|jgi:hypothetical protein|nr:DUF4097 family beta strand repeat protein [bacterium]